MSEEKEIPPEEISHLQPVQEPAADETTSAAEPGQTTN
jgi:hypothetical protein